MQPPAAPGSARISIVLRRLEGRLHIDRRGRSEWIWAIPVVTFAAIIALFVVLGVVSGVWAAEYIPTGLVIAMVISGLLVVCMDPGSELPPAGPGDGDHGAAPSPAPPVPDPTVWVRLLQDAQVDNRCRDEAMAGERVAETAGMRL